MLEEKEELIKESLRYLGYRNQKADETVLRLVQEMLDEIYRIANKKWEYQIFDLQRQEDGILQFGNIETKSKGLTRNLRNCEKIIIFAATLGTEVDRLQARLSVMDMAKAVILQACAAAVLEEYCDACQLQIADDVKKGGYYLRPRFSPGYGDFSIEFQKNIMQLLNCAKKIGLTITDSYMLSPKKSVTAVIGMSRTNEKCHQSGCEVCKKINCEFRRNIE